MKRVLYVKWGELVRIGGANQDTTVFRLNTNLGQCPPPSDDTQVELTWDEPEPEPHQCPDMKKAFIRWEYDAITPEYPWVMRSDNGACHAFLRLPGEKPFCPYCGRRIA